VAFRGFLKICLKKKIYKTEERRNDEKTGKQKDGKARKRYGKKSVIVCHMSD